MLATQLGVRDGHVYPSAFLERQEYEIDDGLLRSFIDLGVVELTDPPKSEGNAPANKARKAAPENKSK